MKRTVVLALLASLALALAGCATMEPMEALLRGSERAMGSAQLKTLRYTAMGNGSSFGQAWQPGMAWPRIRITNFARWIDYEHGAMREDSARARAEPTGGSALPPMGAGEQRTSGWLRGDVAWNVAGNSATAAPAAVTTRIHDLWTTPHGVVKAALRNPRTLSIDGTAHVVSFQEPGRYRATLWIGADGLVQRVDSVVPQAVSGDTPVTTLYLDWRDFGGLKFPTHIIQHQGGFQVLDLAVSEVRPNEPVAIDVPPGVAAATEQVDVQQVADGVWFLAGSSHNSVLVEFADHTVLVESPLYDGRAQAVFAQARRLAPGKPVRYVINSHHHFDHSGGLRAAAAEGATLVVSEQARPWFERAFAQPNQVRPDALLRSGRKPEFIGVNGQRSLRDATRELEIFMIEDSLHAQGFMMVWLPRERLLIEADAFTPGPPNAPAPAQPNALSVNLAANIERLKLDVDRILPLHGRVAPVAELYTAIGKKP